MSIKQANFESFINAQQKRHQEVWFKFLPDILQSLAAAVVQTKTALASNDEQYARFESNTLIRLRNIYSEIKKLAAAEHTYENYKDSQKLIREMIYQINMWFRSSKVAVGIKETINPKYVGSAAIAEKFEIIIGNNFHVTSNCLRSSF